MIENRWYAVLESRELPRRRPLGVERFGERLVLWRTADGPACAVDRCCHRGAALSAGEITGDDRLQCPFHGFEYDAAGRCRLIPAAGRAADVPARYRVRAYPARESHGFIFVWWGTAEPDPPVPPFFPGLDGFRSSTLVDRWPVHYSRVIENQLDLAHLPFVHRTTIGRGNRTIVNGPRTVLEGDWDMGIAADIVRAWDGLDVLVLASGDGDFVPILEVAQQRGVRVEVAAFRATTSQELIDLADRFDDLAEIEGIFVGGE